VRASAPARVRARHGRDPRVAPIPSHPSPAPPLAPAAPAGCIALQLRGVAGAGWRRRAPARGVSEFGRGSDAHRAPRAATKAVAPSRSAGAMPWTALKAGTRPAGGERRVARNPPWPASVVETPPPSQQSACALQQTPCAHQGRGGWSLPQPPTNRASEKNQRATTRGTYRARPPTRRPRPRARGRVDFSGPSALVGSWAPARIDAMRSLARAPLSAHPAPRRVHGRVARIPLQRHPLPRATPPSLESDTERFVRETLAAAEGGNSLAAQAEEAKAEVGGERGREALDTSTPRARRPPFPPSLHPSARRLPSRPGRRVRGRVRRLAV